MARQVQPFLFQGDLLLDQLVDLLRALLDRRLPQAFRLSGEALRVLLQRGQAGFIGRLGVRGEYLARRTKLQPVVPQGDGRAGIGRGIFPRLLGIVQLLPGPIGGGGHRCQAEQGNGDQQAEFLFPG